MFINESDYDVQVRQEILSLLDTSEGNANLGTAERMAIDQIKQYIGGRYDCDTIFSATGENRDMFIVMITIDIALYHLWSKRAPRKIPELRAQRYQDALDWLKGVGDGTLKSDLPQLDSDSFKSETSIESRYKQNFNKY